MRKLKRNNKQRVDLLVHELLDKFYLKDFIRLDEIVRVAVGDFIRKLDKGAIYSILIRGNTLGYDGGYLRNFGGKNFLLVGETDNKFIDTCIYLIRDGLFKYSLDSDYKTMISLLYYKNMDHCDDTMTNHLVKYAEADLRALFYNDKLINKDFIQCQGLEYTHTYDYPLIKPVKSNNMVQLPVAVIDLETYREKGGKLRVYAAGYKISDKIVMMYLTDYESSEDMIENFLVKLFDAVPNGTVIYAHNFERFDGILLFGILRNMEKRGKIKMSYIISASSIKLIKILLSKNKSVRIHDSYNLLGSSLKKLGTAFKVNNEKGIFPHSFVDEGKLTYVGKKPGKEYYEGLKDEEYEEIKTEGWNLREECMKYLRADLECLNEIIDIFGKLIIEEYKVDIGKVVSISALAFRIYRSKYYKTEFDARIISGNVYKDIKRGFYGGKCEVYKRKGTNLYYYDVNSLYPYSMLRDMPVGNPTLRYFKVPVNGEILKDIFGFAQVKIKAPKGLSRPIIPVKIDGRIYNGLGQWEGMYFIEELKQAMELGYEVSVEYVYQFKRGKDIFKNYVKDNYDKKAQNTGSKRQLYKLLLNSLFGRLGMLEYYNDKIVITEEELLEYDKSNKIIDIQELGGEDLIIEVDKMKRSGLDIEGGKTEVKILKNIQSLPIAAAITAYSRMYMNEIIMNEDYGVYYTDTDSLVLDKPLPKELVSSKRIGKFKLEHKVVEGVFIVPKVYGAKCKGGKYITKIKGVKSPVLYEDMEKWVEGKEKLTFKERRMYRSIKGEIRDMDIQLVLSNELKGRRITRGFNTKPVNINKL